MAAKDTAIKPNVGSRSRPATFCREIQEQSAPDEIVRYEVPRNARGKKRLEEGERTVVAL